MRSGNDAFDLDPASGELDGPHGTDRERNVEYRHPTLAAGE
jgi:hypothetical protein